MTAKHLFPGRFPVERGHDLPVPGAGPLVEAAEAAVVRIEVSTVPAAG